VGYQPLMPPELERHSISKRGWTHVFVRSYCRREFSVEVPCSGRKAVEQACRSWWQHHLKHCPQCAAGVEFQNLNEAGYCFAVNDRLARIYSPPKGRKPEDLYEARWHRVTGWTCGCPARGDCKHRRVLQWFAPEPQTGDDP
jgi:hypothetical protein